MKRVAKGGAVECAPFLLVNPPQVWERKVRVCLRSNHISRSLSSRPFGGVLVIARTVPRCFRCSPRDAAHWLEAVTEDALSGDVDALRNLPSVIEHWLSVTR